MQSNQMVNLKEHFRRSSNVLPVFGIKRAHYGIRPTKNSIKRILVFERIFEPKVTKKTNQYITLKLGDIQ